jgi:enoyl-CoA hydratase/carnithine racemase
MGLDRPDKRNAFDMAMLEELAMAYAEVDRNDTIRAGVLYGRGPHFTAGFDLREVVPRLQAGERLVPEGGIDPWGLDPDAIRKPIVAATHGKCLTLGIELLLAADVRVAAETASFAQLEVGRGIFPFGGATLRFPQVAGWGNAMRWMLTGEEFDATEALRLGLIQEVVADGILSSVPSRSRTRSLARHRSVSRRRCDRRGSPPAMASRQRRSSCWAKYAGCSRARTPAERWGHSSLVNRSTSSGGDGRDGVISRGVRPLRLRIALARFERPWA